MPRTEEQNKEIRDSRKLEIKTSALRLFATNGYHQTSIANIAKEAGISKGLIYSYFESKEELIKEIVFDEINNVMQYFDPNHDGVLEPDEMEFFIRKSLELIKNNPEFWKLYFSLGFQSDVMELFMDRIMELYAPMLAMVNKFFQERGYEKPEVMTRYFSSVLDGVGMHYIFDPENYPIDEVTEMLIKRVCEEQPKPKTQ